MAAKKSGYKASDLKSIADKLLSNDNIIKELNRQLYKQINSLRIQKGYVIKKLLQIAEFSLEEEDILDKEGNISKTKSNVLDREKFDRLQKYTKHIISEISNINVNEFDKIEDNSIDKLM